MISALNRSSLKHQLVVLIGLLALVSTLLFASLASVLSRHQLQHDRGQLMGDVAASMSNQLSRDLNTRANELKLLAQMDRIRDPLRPAEDKLSMLQLVKKSYPFYAWIGLTDNEGHLVASTEPALTGKNVAHREWFTGGRTKLHFEDVHSALLLQQYLPAPTWDDMPTRLVDIATPVRDSRGRFVGVLAAHLSLDWAFEARALMLAQLKSEGLSLMVLNRKNELMLGTEDMPSMSGDLSALSVVRLLTSHEQKAGIETWPDGRDYLTAAVTDKGFQSFPGMGWTVVVRTPVDTAFASANQLTLWLLAAGAASAVVFSLLMWWVVNRQLRPLTRITEAAQRVRENDLSEPLPEPEGSSEVAVFARSLTGVVNALSESQERFRRLFDHAPVAMTHLARDGQVLARNARFDRLFGYAHAEISHADDWFRLVFHDDAERARAKALWAAALRNATETHADIGISEHRVTTRDGVRRVVQISGIVLDDGVLTSFHDVTKLRQAELRVRLWAASFEQSQLGLMISDARTNSVVTVNAAFARERGYEREEMTGMTLSELLPPDRTADMRRIIQALEKDNHGLFETEHISRTGYRFPVLMDVTVLRNEKGRAVHRVVFAWNLTEHKQAEQEILRLNAELEQRVADRTAELSAANRELDAFAYTVSHDLRAPLRTMNGFAQILLTDHGEALPDDAKACMDRILQSSRRMGELIEGLLTLSHSGRTELKRKPVDLSGLASKRLADLALSEPGRQVEIEVETGLHAIGDPRMLDVVMTNLIDNAWKYSAKNPQARIRVYAGTVRNVQGFCVSDNGAGFDMTHAQMLFQPFQRMHRQDEFAGTGVGLATVQRIIERHGGQLVVEAAKGQGASFCFTLPRIGLPAPPPTQR